ncbi:EFR1 family ferrodoxin [Fusibacter paucivorans]|uniref:Ferredoxin n=1 Tax=Fusibacter paucivorans TaxID=76009 RepID=A0ABS5PPM3_9FIRM|nr:EFR1 family ferrodoxin [Fusibacter paucivorans]MBS7526872.1 EFR1 family ferrodoxin [Fusibacter paucivorans]
MHTLYYFSGTGNSMHAAIELAKRTNGKAKPLLSVKDTSLSGEVGLIFPVYMNGLPKPVEAFIRQADFSKVTYLYAVTTHGGVPGKPEHYLKHLLEKYHQIALDDYHAIEMINNTPKGVAPKFLMHLDWETEITAEKRHEMLAREMAAIDTIAEAVNHRSIGFKEALVMGINKISWAGKLMWHIDSSPKLIFEVDDTCTGCGICEEVCLSNRIKLLDYPMWADMACYYCYACFNFCPQQAIYVKHYKKKMGRYHHPSMAQEAIASQKLLD